MEKHENVNFVHGVIYWTFSSLVQL